MHAAVSYHLAQGRLADLRRHAQRDRLGHAARRAGDAPTRRPRSAARAAALGDGSRVLTRQIHAADAPLVADIFGQLSDTSRWMQFLAAKKELSAAELRYLTDVDHHDHEALVALDHTAGRGVGLARYIRHTTDPQAAEIAVTVVDSWHGRGLGTELLIQLSGRARQEGIGRFTAVASADNAAAAGLLRTMRADLVGHEYDTVEYEINLAQLAPGGLYQFSIPYSAILHDPHACQGTGGYVLAGRAGR